jgi:hypothetical protein
MEDKVCDGNVPVPSHVNISVFDVRTLGYYVREFVKLESRYQRQRWEK